MRPSTPSEWAETASSCARARRRSGYATSPLLAKRRRLLQCSSCPYGCRLDAKRAMHVSYLPRAVAAGARVRARVEARRILRARPGRGLIASPASPIGRARPPFQVGARRRSSLPGGASGRRSSCSARASARGAAQLGHNLRIHPACWVGARFAEEVRGWDGVMQSYAVDEWQDRGILLEATFTPLAFGAHWLPGTGVEHQSGSRLRPCRIDRGASVGPVPGRVGLARDGSLRITYRLTREDAARLIFGIARAAELLYAAGAREVYPQLAGFPSLPKTGSQSWRPRPRPPADAPRGLPPDGDGADGRRSRRRAWSPPTARCTAPRPSCRRREPVPELDRRQPDDDDHRDGLRIARELADRLGGREGEGSHDS